MNFFVLTPIYISSKVEFSFIELVDIGEVLRTLITNYASRMVQSHGDTNNNNNNRQKFALSKLLVDINRELRNLVSVQPFSALMDKEFQMEHALIIYVHPNHTITTQSNIGQKT